MIIMTVFCYYRNCQLSKMFRYCTVLKFLKTLLVTLQCEKYITVEHFDNCSYRDLDMMEVRPNELYWTWGMGAQARRV